VFVVLTGYVDAVSASVDTGVRFRISGRDITNDLVDCSVTKASEWKDLKFEDFVQDLIEPFPIEVVLDSVVDTGDVIPTINYEQGSKVYELIAKHAQLKQLILITLPDGRLLITRASTERVTDEFGKTTMSSFIEGDNILSITANTNWSEVFSEYIVKGSRQSTVDDATEEEATQIEGCTTDTRIPRFRPLIIVPDAEQSNVSAKKRADWEATTRIGAAEDYTIIRQGWQPSINKLAYVKSPSLAVDGDYVIASFRLIADESGKRTEFNFVHPRVFTPLEADEVVKDEKDTELAKVE